MKTVKCFAFVNEQGTLEPKSISLNKDSCKGKLFHLTDYQTHNYETWEAYEKWFNLGKIVEMFVVVDDDVDLRYLTTS